MVVFSYCGGYFVVGGVVAVLSSAVEEETRRERRRKLLTIIAFISLRLLVLRVHTGRTVDEHKKETKGKE